MADEAGVGRYDDFAVASGAADVHTFAAAGGAFEEDFFDAADEGFVAGEGVFAEDVDEYLVALFFDFGGDGVAQWLGGGTGAHAVFEEVGHVEADVFEVLAGELEVFFGFAGEADNDIGGNVDTGADFADAVDDAAEALDGVGSAHGFEDTVAPALDGEMEVLAEFGQSGVALDEVFAEADGVRGGEADALDAVDVVDSLEELDKGAFAVDYGEFTDGVLVNNLPEEGDFAGAGGGELLDFLDDGFDRAGAFGAAGLGNDAVAAIHIAALHNADEGGDLLLVL